MRFSRRPVLSLPIRVGILGTGYMAATMARAMALTPDLRVVALAGASQARSEALGRDLGGDVRAHVGRDSLLDDAEVDLVYLATVTERHAADALAALEAGKSVLVEKPLATTAEEATRVVEAARAARRFCMEAMWTAFLPSWKRLVAIAGSGELGRPRHLAFSFGYPVERATAPRVFVPGPGAGVLLDRGVYGAALALRLLGPAECIEALVERSPEGVDVAAALQLGHRGGAQSQIAVSIEALLPNTVTLSCTSGTAEVAAPALGSELVMLRRANASVLARAGEGRKAALVARLREVPLVRRLRRVQSRPAHEHWTWGADMYLPLLTHVAETLRAGDIESSEVPLDASIAALALLDGARVAAHWASGAAPAGASR